MTARNVFCFGVLSFLAGLAMMLFAAFMPGPGRLLAASLMTALGSLCVALALMRGENLIANKEKEGPSR